MEVAGETALRCPTATAQRDTAAIFHVCPVGATSTTSQVITYLVYISLQLNRDKP